MRRYNAKRVKTSCYQEGVGQFEPRFQGVSGRPWRIFFGFYKTRHILLSDSAYCTVLRALVLRQYRRMTDGRTDRQTDGIAVASTALAMRALRRAVKSFIMANRKSYTGFPTSHHPRFYAAPNFLKIGIKYLNLLSFIQVSTIKDEKSAAKFHCIKTVSSKVVAQSIAFRAVSIYWQGVAPFP